MGVRKIIRGQTDKIKLDGMMTRSFVDGFWNQEKDPEVIRAFWEKHKTRLMTWWLEGTELACDEPVITLSKIEDRLFFRPELWWVFEATKPLKHYMVERHRPKISYIYPNGRPPSTPGFKDEECHEEDEGLYLQRHGLLSDIEKQTEFEPYLVSRYSPTEEVSPFKVPANATACTDWKCHIDQLDWKTRLGFAYGLEKTGSLKDHLDQEEYLKINDGNPYS